MTSRENQGQCGDTLLCEHHRGYRHLVLPEFADFLPPVNDAESEDTEQQFPKEKSDDEDTAPNEKPWIENLTSSQMKREYGHLSINSLHNDIEDAKEMFKALNINSNPIPSYEEDIDCVAFPNIFPYGEGGRRANRNQPLQDATFEKTHVLSADAYKRQNKQYLLHMALQRRVCSVCSTARTSL